MEIKRPLAGMFGRPKGFRLFVATFVVLTSISSISSSDELDPKYKERVSNSDFGGVGLLQTRSARMGKDGGMSVGFGQTYPYRNMFINMQIFPALEAVFRYTQFRDIPFKFGTSSGHHLDRGVDLKLGILEESDLLPAVVVGLQDGLGTGIFSGEYIALSKAYHDLDFSFGLRWGYGIGEGDFKNPLISISNTFATRSTDFGKGGETALDSYFSGERISAFGGVEYHTPIEGLSLKLEYDPNDYQLEPLTRKFEFDSHFNFGLNYRPWPWMNTSLGWERGNKAMARFSLRTNFYDAGMPKFLDPPPPIVVPRDRQEPSVNRYDPSSQQVASAIRTKPFQSAFDQEMAGRKIAPGVERNVATGNMKQAGGNIAQIVGESDLVDFLYSEVGRLGYEIQDLSLSGTDLELLVSKVSSGDIRQNELLGIASLARETLAGKFSAGTIFATGVLGGKITYSFDLQSLDNEVLVENLYRKLEEIPVEISTFEMDETTVRLGVVRQKRRQERQQDGELLARIAKLTFEVLQQERESLEVFFEDKPTQAVYISSNCRSSGQCIPVTFSNASSSGSSVPSAGIDQPKTNWQAVASELFTILEISGLSGEELFVDGRRATLTAEAGMFRGAAKNIGRSARAMAIALPKEYEIFDIVMMRQGLEVSKTSLYRRDLENAVIFEGSPEEIWAKSETVAGGRGNNGTLVAETQKYPNFSWGVAPRLRQHVGAPEEPYLFQLWLSMGASLQFSDRFSISGLVGRDIYNTFNKIQRDANSRLENVRSDIGSYLKQGKNNLVRLEGNYQFNIGPELYARVTAGYLEEMYAGFSSEVLYRPHRSRISIGADVHRIRQREFKQRLKFREYRVVTGHINLYYETPFYDVLAAIHAGRYLAKDVGATYSLSRLFKNGVRVGAWATFTDVSAEDFGEGSFDKGFMISLPLDLFYGKSSQQAGAFGFRPLARDGGQMLNGSKRLYSNTMGNSFNNISQDWKNVLH